VGRERHRVVWTYRYEGFLLIFGGFGGLVVSMLASGTQVRGFKPGRSLSIFFGRKKFFSMPSFADLRYVKNPFDLRGNRNRSKIDRPFLARLHPSLTEVSHVA
jgi:hypothetical protein